MTQAINRSINSTVRSCQICLAREPGLLPGAGRGKLQAVATEARELAMWADSEAGDSKLVAGDPELVVGELVAGDSELVAEATAMTRTIAKILINRSFLAARAGRLLRA